MNRSGSTSSAASRERQALAAIRILRSRLDEALSARAEPIAIIGLSCRLPGGVTDGASFWHRLSTNGDGIVAIPRERLELAGLFDPRRDMPGKTYSHWAGLIAGADQFDAAFFGISPCEAVVMDPQQRLFLEGSWLALEHAGIAPTSLLDSNTGVFVGITSSEYARLHDRLVAVEDIGSYYIQGLSPNAVAGRVAHVLGLLGPALAVDTACSSSLVALDRACRSLREAECELAIAGGVNIIAMPEGLVAGSQIGMLAADGRCKSFSAAADGFVRGEGCGVVVLKRLRDAVAVGDRVLAVIRGSAVNNDGPSSGLTVPNGLAQQALLRRALKQAGVAPSEVGYVEAHGTGTSLGDPIEAEALGAVMDEGRPADRPLLIGSVKTNIGHLEAAAGVAGLIKVVLALQHGQLPAQLHWNTPSPHIRWDKLKLRVVDRLQAWEPINGRRLAGVSSFGFSGTNAHVVLEEAPSAAEFEQRAARPVEVLPLSAKSAAALRMMAAQYRDRLRGMSTAEEWADLCFTAGVGRSALAHRLSVRAKDAAAAASALDAFVAGNAPAAVARGEAKPGAGSRVGFLLTGQGAQYAGMGAALYAHAPRFRQIVDEAEAALAGQLPVSLGAVLRGEVAQAAQLINETLYTQPALYVLEYGLAMLWQSLGVRPVALLGHSLGEYVGCAVAGVFGFKDGLRLVADRARLMHGLKSDGAMLVVVASEAEIGPLLNGQEAALALAGINAAKQVTVSGERRAIEALASQCAARGWRHQTLPVSQAFHSPLMAPIEEAFAARAGEIAYSAPLLPVISNVTGKVLERVDGGYWRRHLRQTVRFSDGLATLAELGCDVLLELGPKPVLLQLARQAASSTQGGAEWRYVKSLKGPGMDEWETFSQAVQELHAAGAALDWAGWHRDYRRRKVDAPLYPFERQRYWISASGGTPNQQQRSAAPGGHPLLGTRLRSALPGGQFEAVVSAAGATAWLGDHRIAGQVLMPATGLIETMLAAGEALDERWNGVEDLSILAPLVFAGARTVQTVVDEAQDGRARVRIFAAAADAAGNETPAAANGQLRFRLHAEATLVSAAASATAADLAALRRRCVRAIDSAAHYRRLAERGAIFGQAFRNVQQLWAGDNEALGEITVALPPLAGIRPHPAILDACLQVAAATLADSGDTFVPVALARFAGGSVAWPASIVVHARLVADDPLKPVCDFTIYHPDGDPLAQFDGLAFHNVTAKHEDDPQSWLYESQWKPCPGASHVVPSNSALRGHWLLLADKRGVARALADRIAAGGGTFVLAAAGDAYRCIDHAQIELDAASPDDVGALLGAAGEESFNGVIDFWSLDCHFDLKQAPQQVLAEQTARYASALHLVQALLRDRAAPPLYFVTAEAAPLDATPGAPSFAMLSAFRKTLQAEYPEQTCRLIDLDNVHDPGAAAVSLIAELSQSDEPEVALRAGSRFAPRLVACSREDHARAEDDLVELVPAPSGLIDELSFAVKQRVEPKSGEVEIAVRVTGLNFRDVLNALGMFPGTLLGLGGECAGVITRAGQGATFSPGDEVMAFCPGQSGSFVTVPAAYVARKPKGLDFAQAAALPVAYMTALYGLYRLGNLQFGQTILIHAAAGGLGSAATQLALAHGARVYATAGTDAKRERLRKFGAVGVFSSRKLGFADAILEETKGRGVDIVLNTLSGDFVPESFRALAKGGTFIEVGKLGVFTPAQARTHRADVVYHQFDLGEEAERDETLIPSLLALIDKEAVPPLDVERFPYREAKAAFRKMAEARHTGKLVLEHCHISGAEAPVARAGAYLITGGFGALGLQTADWLSARGVETLILVGLTERRSEITARIEARGTKVIPVEADCADTNALRAILELIPSGQRLRGVIHCAGRLSDATLPQQSASSFMHVADAKVGGALALHQAFDDQDLEAFILFSSAAAVIGSAGQANYAAANAILSAVARARRTRGRAALCVDWGPWAAGMAASERVSRRDLGLAPMAPPEAFKALEQLLDHAGSEASVLSIRSWKAFFAAHPREQHDPFFVQLRGADGAGASIWTETSNFTHQLKLLSADACRPALLDHLRAQAAKVLRSDPSDYIPGGLPLQERGLDSLMSVELRNLLVKSLGLPLPATLLLDYPTLDGVCEYLLSQHFAPATATPDWSDDSDDFASLSEAEAEVLLKQELESLDV